MYLADYHMHSKYSFDGHEEVIDLCEEAIRKGLQEIAITDHYDFFKDKQYAPYLDFENLYKDIALAKERYKGKLIVRAGIELGQPRVCPDESADFLAKYDLDFVIGSIHHLEDKQDVGDYNFSKTDIRVVYKRYLQALLDMAKQGDFDIMGHITYPIRYAYQQTGEYPDLTPYYDTIVEIYQHLIKRGKGIEVNASGFFQPINRSMPDLDLVKLYKANGGEIITVGCDAHYLKHVGVAMHQGLKVVKEAGFEYVTTFEKRKQIFKPI